MFIVIFCKSSPGMDFRSHFNASIIASISMRLFVVSGLLPEM